MCLFLILHWFFSGPQSLDELDDDDPGEKERREEEALVQANTYQNEAMTADTNSGHLLVRCPNYPLMLIDVRKRFDRKLVGVQTSLFIIVGFI